jgi:polyphosphate kinase
MDLLIEAVHASGKEVLVVVELKARFDEEANINWAERLEAVGAQVVYGVVGLKTHAKLLLVTRREGAQLAPLRASLHRQLQPRHGQRLYTDVGMLTADPGLTGDADRVFLQLASQTRATMPRHLLTAPFQLHRRLLRHRSAGGPGRAAGARAARIVVKVNATHRSGPDPGPGGRPARRAPVLTSSCVVRACCPRA